MKNYKETFLQLSRNTNPHKDKSLIALSRIASTIKNSRRLTLFLFSMAYGLLLFAIIHFMLIGNQMLEMTAIYLYGLVGGYAVILLKKSYSETDQSQNILSQIIENSIEARIVISPADTIVYSNARFRELIGYTENPTLMSILAISEDPNQTRKKIEMLYQKSQEEGNASDEIMLRDGRRLQISCQPIAGWVGYMQWRLEDITARYQMEATVREEREKLREFTESAPVGFFSIDENGRFQFANEALLQLLGTDSVNLIGRAHLHDFFLEKPPLYFAPYDCFKTGGLHQHGDLMIRGAGGRIFKAAITHSINQKEDGRVVTCSILYDLTAEQKMQQALKDSEDRFQRLFEEAPVGICLLSPRGIVSNANQTLGTMLKLPAATLNSRPLIHFVAKDLQDRAKEIIRRLGHAKDQELNFELTLKGNVEITVQIYARKLRSGDSYVLHFIDLSEQKKLERQFAQSQKMQAIGQLAGGIAHDFNNLLTAMIGFCDLLLLRHKPGDPSFADIMQIKQNSNRAANLVRQLLAFSRQQTLQPRVLDLTDVLAELSHLVRRLIGVNIELKLNHGNGLWLIYADQGQIEQVLVNLVVNARDAMPKGGKLTIHTFNTTNTDPRKLANEEFLPSGEWVTVQIEDTGIGISSEIIPRIFEPFFSTKDVGAGTGLGLATVHGIVHQTGGFIDVKSRPGSGTTFCLYLPRHIETETEKKIYVEEKTQTTDLTGSSTILLVEDEDAVRAFTTRALSNKGYQVIDAASAASALSLLEEKKIAPEVLITDIMMPEMDGTTLARIVREKYPHIKIIFISGYAEDRFKDHIGEEVWFLPKPFTLKQLATKVKEVIES